LNENLKDALGTFGSFIGSSQMKISPPPLYEGERAMVCISDCTVSRTFEIKKPFQQTYTDVRDYILGRLKQATDKTPINTIIVSYEFIGVLAYRTTCFVPGSEERYQAEALYYVRQAREWKNVLGSRVGLHRGSR
jgi:hypothetical protein